MNHLLRGKGEKKWKEGLLQWANRNPVLLGLPGLPQPPCDNGSLVAQTPQPLPLDKYLASSSNPYALGNLCLIVQNMLISSPPTFK